MLITELAGFFAISGFSYSSEVVLRFENGTQALPNDRVIVRYNHVYRLRRNLERCFHDTISKALIEIASSPGAAASGLEAELAHFLGIRLTSVVKEREFSAHASQEKGRFARTAK